MQIKICYARLGYKQYPYITIQVRGVRQATSSVSCGTKMQSQDLSAPARGDTTRPLPFPFRDTHPDVQGQRGPAGDVYGQPAGFWDDEINVYYVSMNLAKLERFNLNKLQFETVY
jgi:hypothetical protein